VGKFINAGIIHEDVEAAKILDSCINDALRICGLGNTPPTATTLPPAATMAATTESAPALLEALFTTTDAPSAASALETVMANSSTQTHAARLRWKPGETGGHDFLRLWSDFRRRAWDAR
jgi:hypothetical protein